MVCILGIPIHANHIIAPIRLHGLFLTGATLIGAFLKCPNLRDVNDFFSVSSVFIANHVEIFPASFRADRVFYYLQ